MTEEVKYFNEKLIEFIEKSPTAYNATEEAAKMLDEAGFKKVPEYESPDADSIKDEKGFLKYYTVKNNSALIAAKLPAKEVRSLMITAVHADSPTFRIKEDPEIKTEGYIRLGVEKYGGMICHTWTDRPLSCAGLATIREKDGRIKIVTVDLKKDMFLIPNVAIHMDRTVNDGKKFDPAVDMLPLSGLAGAETLKEKVAKELGTSPEDIISTELYLYNRTPGSIWGDEFISAPRLDDLQCAYACLRAFSDAENSETGNIFCMLDNEEVGSGTKQGADSEFLKDFINELGRMICKDDPGIFVKHLISRSFMVSADNAHAVHPNHPEFSDPKDRPVINGGITVKYNAARKYTTDCVSESIFEEIMKKAGVPVQHFSNKANMPGGSTLGNISSSHVSLDTVDIGLAQLAMHSAYETAGCKDTVYLYKGAKAFYETEIIRDNNMITLSRKA